MLSKLVQFNCIFDGGMETGTQMPLGEFRDFLEKSHFNAIWIIIRTFLEPFERTNLLRFKSHFKRISRPASSASLYLQVKFKTRLNASILELNFLNDLDKRG